MPNQEIVYSIRNLKDKKGAEKIIGAVNGLQGINNVDVDVKGKKVIVNFSPGSISVQSVRKAIQDQGFEVV